MSKTNLTGGGYYGSEVSSSERKNWELVNFCEFDKFAIKSYCAIHNVDESLNLGDITKVDETKIKPFNMICGGSPCQDFSVAGKQRGSVWTCKDCEHEYNPLTVHWDKRDKCPNCHSINIEKTRSSLLVEYLRIIRANKPNFGIYENVKNIVGKKFINTTFKMFEDELHEYGYNTYWKVLNAKNYGIPQNRERVYLIFIRKDLDNGQFKFPEPFDNGVRLKDILEDDVDEKFYLSDDKVQKFLSNFNQSDLPVTTRNSNISSAVRASYYKNGSRNIFENVENGKRYEGVVESNSVKQIGNISNSNSSWSNPQTGRIYSPDGISPTLNTCGGGQREPKIVSIGNINPSGRGMNGNIFSSDGLAPTVTTNKGEGSKVLIPQATKQGYIECEIGGVADLSYPNSKTRRGRVQDGGHISPTITATETDVCRIETKERFYKQALETFGGSNADYGDTIDAYNKRVNQSGFSPTITTRPEGFKTAILPVTKDIRIRKLTPKETWRLMGFSDQDFDTVSNVGISKSQLYKQAGNSIVVDVLYYIYVELYKAMPYLFDDLKLSSFFSGIGAFEVALDRLYDGINSGNFINPQVE